MTEPDTVPEPDAYGVAGSSAPRQASVSGRDTTPARPTGPSPSAALTGQAPIRVVRRPSQQTAALRQELDEKAAATDELREALDELRQVLDVDNHPPPTGAHRGRARLALVGVTVVAIATILTYLVLNRDGEAIVRSPEPSPSPPATAASTATASATPAGTVQPLPWPGGAVVAPPGLAASGPGVTTPGSVVQVALDDDGTHLDVVERLLLDAPTGDALVLAAPVLAVPALHEEGTAPVSDLQVQLDDVVTAATATDTGRWAVTPAAGSRYERATLRYRLGGAVVTVTPAPPGRALGVVTPLTAAVSQGRGHDVVVRTLDPRVIGVSCPGAAGTGTVCGTRTDGGWTAHLPGDAQPLVLLQVQR
ncbi:MAG TPA: hypothetical protein VI248_26965 [Kineosporiaceae bacterium]